MEYVYSDADQVLQSSPTKPPAPRKVNKGTGLNQKKLSPGKHTFLFVIYSNNLIRNSIIFFCCEEVKTGPRVVHYDSEKVRQYIDKKKTERHRKIMTESLSKKEAARLRKKRLDELYERQKKGLRSALKNDPISDDLVSHLRNTIIIKTEICYLLFSKFLS